MRYLDGYFLSQAQTACRISILPVADEASSCTLIKNSLMLWKRLTEEQEAEEQEEVKVHESLRSSIPPLSPLMFSPLHLHHSYQPFTGICHWMLVRTWVA